MSGPFINFTNHPTEMWKKEEREAAERYGPILDMRFPAVNPEESEKEVLRRAKDCAKAILQKNPSAVLCQGEFTMCYAVVGILRSNGIPVLAACSKRNTIEKDGTKISTFDFVRFREYRN